MLQSLNEIMDYVEVHIEEDLKGDDLAKKSRLVRLSFKENILIHYRYFNRRIYKKSKDYTR